jgi:small-conductance mechanosensitive channel
MFVDPAKRFQALRDLRTQIKLLFDRNNISIPYNHLVIGDYKDEVNNTYIDAPEAAEKA